MKKISTNKHKCDKCDKEFTSYRALNGHMRMHGKSKGKLIPKRSTKTFKCKECNKINKQNVRSHKQFCNSQCSTNYTWKKKHLPRILEGVAGPTSVKTYLIKTYGDKCSQCGISEWQGQKLSIQLDHIDGDSDNNKLENCRLLCPNCHSLTPTFSGKNTKVLKETKRNTFIRNYYKRNKDKWN